MSLKQTTQDLMTLDSLRLVSVVKSDFSDLLGGDELYFDPVEELQLLDELGLLCMEEDEQ